MGVKLLWGLRSGGILKEWGGIQITMIHTLTHSRKATLPHLFTLSLIHVHLQVELEIAHKGILHLFHSTRGLVGSDGSDRDQGSDWGRAGLSNLTWFVLSLTCWACCRSSMRSCKIWLSNCRLCRRIWRRSLSTASLSSSLCLSVSDSATAWHAGCSCCRALYSVASSSSILCTASHIHTYRYTNTHTQTHTHGRAHAHAETHTGMHKHKHGGTKKQINIYTQTHTYTHYCDHGRYGEHCSTLDWGDSSLILSW